MGALKCLNLGSLRYVGDGDLGALKCLNLESLSYVGDGALGALKSLNLGSLRYVGDGDLGALKCVGEIGLSGYQITTGNTCMLYAFFPGLSQTKERKKRNGNILHTIATG